MATTGSPTRSVDGVAELGGVRPLDVRDLHDGDVVAGRGADEVGVVLACRRTIFTLMVSAPSITWLLVSTSPSSLMMTPEPAPRAVDAAGRAAGRLDGHDRRLDLGQHGVDVERADARRDRRGRCRTVGGRPRLRRWTSRRPASTAVDGRRGLDRDRTPHATSAATARRRRRRGSARPRTPLARRGRLRRHGRRRAARRAEIHRGLGRRSRCVGTRVGGAGDGEWGNGAYIGARRPRRVVRSDSVHWSSWAPGGTMSAGSSGNRRSGGASRFTRSTELSGGNRSGRFSASLAPTDEERRCTTTPTRCGWPRGLP